MVNQIFDEKSVLKGCLNNDLRCQKLLYERYKVAMFTLCLRYAIDRAEAEDMLQDGFIQVFKEMHQYDAAKGVFEGWMRRVIVNVALQLIRKKKMDFVEMDEVQLQISSDEDVVSQMSYKELLAQIQKLPTGYRTIFNLYAIDGLQHNEIAEMFNISINTSKTQLFKAKQLLKKLITEAHLFTTH